MQKLCPAPTLKLAESNLDSQRRNASFFIKALCHLPNPGPVLASQGS
jgi:hypothetical protein